MTPTAEFKENLTNTLLDKSAARPYQFIESRNPRTELVRPSYLLIPERIYGPLAEATN